MISSPMAYLHPRLTQYISVDYQPFQIWVCDRCDARCLAGREPCSLRPAAHHPGCSNQNALHPLGAFIGAKACGCNDRRTRE